MEHNEGSQQPANRWSDDIGAAQPSASQRSRGVTFAGLFLITMALVTLTIALVLAVGGDLARAAFPLIAAAGGALTALTLLGPLIGGNVGTIYDGGLNFHTMLALGGAVVHIVPGIGLLKGYRWARPTGIVVCVVALPLAVLGAFLLLLFGAAGGGAFVPLMAGRVLNVLLYLASAVLLLGAPAPARRQHLPEA